MTYKPFDRDEYFAALKRGQFSGYTEIIRDQTTEYILTFLQNEGSEWNQVSCLYQGSLWVGNEMIDWSHHRETGEYRRIGQKQKRSTTQPDRLSTGINSSPLVQN